MIGGGFIGDGFLAGGYAADEGAYQDWARDGDARIGHVAHIGYHGDSAVYPNYVKRLWKVRDFADGTDATHAVMRDRIEKIPTFSRAISDDLYGPVADSFGELVLDNRDGALDLMLAMSISGQPVRVFHGDPLWANAAERFRLLFEAVAESISAVSQETVTIRLRGIEHGANLPIQTALLPNNTTTGAESNRPIPKAFGNVFNVNPPCIDEANQIYQWNDGAVTSVTQVRDSGVPFNTNPIAISSVNSGTEVITTGSAHGFYQNTRVRCDIGTMPTSGASWGNLIAVGSGFLATSDDTAIVATSINGLKWTQYDAPFALGPVASNNAICCAIRAGSTRDAVTSTDGGSSWTTRSNAMPVTAAWRAITWGGITGAGLFCAVGYDGSNGYIATSPDAITWTLRRTTASRSYQAIIWAAYLSLFVVLASGTANASTSPDATTWTDRSLPASTTWRALESNGTVIVAIADGDFQAASSTNGTSWTAQSLGVGLSWAAIKWVGARFVVVAYNSTAALTSPDGSTWSSQTLPSSGFWYRLAFNGYVVCTIAAFSSLSTISADGATWSGTGNTLPTNLLTGTDYWVIYLTATTFQLAATRGGAAVNLTSTTAGAVLVGYHWEADLTNGRIYLASRPTDPSNLTLDGVAGTTVAGTILATALAAVNVDSVMQTRFASTCAQPVGEYVGDRKNRLEVANDLMSGLAAWYGYSRYNLLRMGRIEASYASHDWTLNADDFKDGTFTLEKMLLPRKQHRLGYRHNNTNQQGKLVAGVSSGDANLFSNDYLITAPTLGADEGSTGSEFHLLAVKPDYIPSAMTYGSDALTEALRRDALFYGWVGVFRGTLKIGRVASEMEPGQVAKVTHSRYGFSAGVRVPIVSIEDQPSDDEAVLRFRALLTNYSPGQI